MAGGTGGSDGRTVTKRSGRWDALIGRLADARYILLGVVAAGLLAWISGFATGAVALVVGVTIAAAFVPRRTPVERAAEERRREEAEGAGRRACEAVLDAIDLPAFLLGEESVLLHANRAATEAFGPIVAGQHLSSRIRSPDILDMVRETMETGRANAIEHSERVPSERWYQVRVAPAGTLMGETAETYLLLFRDVTEMHRIDRMRSDFVANASHELRTPLASLTGFIETLQGPARDDPKARERFLPIMREQAERMGRLVEDLMSLSRLELRAHVAPAGAIDIGPLLVHVCDTLGPLAGELDVAIRFDPPPGPVPVVGDRDELIQVFQNLVENACKYGQPGRFVDVGIERGAGTPEGMVDVFVRDYGPGIAPEHVPRLTERFYRVDVETSRLKKGTGLGLAIVKHILTRHRARLIVRSEVGEGSTFTVRLRKA